MYAMSIRSARNHAGGVHAESLARAALLHDGWTIRATRLRTPAGEVDLAAEKEGVLALIEVKSRRTLCEAASALSTRQRKRLLAAGEIVAAEHPDWCPAGFRFDLMLVDAAGNVRRVANAFRQGDREE